MTALPVPLGAPENAELRQVLLVGLGAASADDFRRAGATLARAVLDRAAVATTITAVEPVGRPRAVRGRHDPGLLRVRLAQGARPSTSRSPGSCWPAWPTPTGPRWSGRSRSAARAGGPARSPRCRPTSRTPPGWPTRPSQLAGEAGLEVRVWDEKQLADDGFGGILGVGQASATPPRLVRLDYTPRQGVAPYADGRAGRQGHHLRHRRSLDQARRGDGQHEARHDRRRRRHVGAGRARRRGLPGAGGRPGAGRRERRRRQRAAPRRRGPPLRRPHHRGHQHRRRGPPGARRRDGVGGRARSSPTCWSTWPRSPARSRWRSDSRSAGCSPTTTRSPTRSSSAARARASRCGGSRWPRSTRSGSRLGSPTPTTPAAGRARSSPRCSSSTSPATCRGRTSTSPRPATPPRTATSTPRAPPASAPGCCSTGSARPTRWPASSLERQSMNGLTVRWSLADAPAGVEEALASYVAETSHARFSAMAGAALQDLAHACRGSGSRAATSSRTTPPARRSRRPSPRARPSRPGSQIIGSPPILIEPCSIVAVAEGASGFVAAPRAE